MIQKFYKYNLEKKQSEKVESHLLFSTLTKDRHCFSFVGAGGKSSLIEVMAAWGTKQGKKVLVTTTTHIFRPEPEKLARTPEDLERIWGAGDWAVIGEVEVKQPQKLKSAGSRLDETGDGTCGFRPDRSRRIKTTAL